MLYLDIKQELNFFSSLQKLWFEEFYSLIVFGTEKQIECKVSSDILKH